MVDGPGRDKVLPSLKFILQLTRDGQKIQLCLINDGRQNKWNPDGLIAATTIDKDQFVKNLGDVLGGLEEGVWYGAATMADVQAYHETGELPPGY